MTELMRVWPAGLRRSELSRERHAKDDVRSRGSREFSVCFHCGGRPRVQGEMCPTCNGRGGWPRSMPYPTRCPMCEGAGHLARRLLEGGLTKGPVCSGCDGLGAVQQFGARGDGNVARCKQGDSSPDSSPRYSVFWKPAPTMVQQALALEKVASRYLRPTSASQSQAASQETIAAVAEQRQHREQARTHHRIAPHMAPHIAPLSTATTTGSTDCNATQRAVQASGISARARFEDGRWQPPQRSQGAS